MHSTYNGVERVQQEGKFNLQWSRKSVARENIQLTME